MQSSLSARFLWLGVVALAIAGLFAIVLVAARTPQLSAFTALFPVALVIHVDLSVLMWFLCFGAASWNLLLEKRPNRWPYWGKASFYLVAAATALMTLSALDTPHTVIKSNYIPVLDNAMFHLSLSLLAAGMVVILVEAIATYYHHRDRRALGYSELGWLYAAFTALLALAAFFISGHGLPESLPHEEKFELLFWAGGHQLQFTYTALMMGAWLLLLKEILGKEPTSFLVFLCFAILAAGALYGFAGFAIHPLDTSDFTYHHTRVMIEWLGVGPTVLAVIVMWNLLRRGNVAPAKAGAHIKPSVNTTTWIPACAGMTQHESRAYKSTLIMSLILFFYGGVLGLMISGQNVTIPAHYHGSIVGVTLALMGAAYALLPKFGYASVAHTRMAFWQPIVYGLGQIMHISGLAYSGGYGVLRKSPDAAETLAANVKIALGFMGLGGLLAIIGGLMFVIVMGRVYRTHRRGNP